ncbi:hypothetical protein [Microbispora corallina]|uniref:hypothetical protein n=1 Tax=Microbispora corallina TaxID=83302 RepID=UPI0019503C93|nr:hypothetical protein [Microbispora corallina]
MSAATRTAVYALGLGVAFAAAFGAGRAVGDADGLGPAPAPTGHAASGGMSMPGGVPGHGADGDAASGGMSMPGGVVGHGAAGHQAHESALPEGLQISQDGYTLRPTTTTLEPGRETEFTFRVIGPDGAPVTRYRTEHGKKLHFIVVSRDLGTFRHVHPALDGSGLWSVRLTPPSAGPYRAFADFAPEGHDPLTLGVDLQAPGGYTPRPLPAPSRTATVDGYTVTLVGALTPGRAAPLTATVTRAGRPVTDLQPYLEAYGHLVALRAGDLAYLHVHPQGAPGDGVTPAGPAITFHAQVPSGGAYRLFLDFRHGGSVHTAAFTVTADGTDG